MRKPLRLGASGHAQGQPSQRPIQIKAIMDLYNKKPAKTLGKPTCCNLFADCRHGIGTMVAFHQMASMDDRPAWTCSIGRSSCM